MNASKLTAIVLIAGGVFGLLYGSFSYTKDTHGKRKRSISPFGWGWGLLWWVACCWCLAAKKVSFLEAVFQHHLVIVPPHRKAA